MSKHKSLGVELAVVRTLAWEQARGEEEFSIRRTSAQARVTREIVQRVLFLLEELGLVERFPKPSSGGAEWGFAPGWPPTVDEATAAYHKAFVDKAVLGEVQKWQHYLEAVRAERPLAPEPEAPTEEEHDEVAAAEPSYGEALRQLDRS